MKKSLLYFTTLLLSSLLSTHILFCESNDRLTPGKFISINDTIISDGGAFALGFFSPTNSTTNLYLGIWYENIPQKTIVWVANRENPIKDSSATVSMSKDMNIVVMDSKARVIWTSNVTSNSSVGNNTEAVLLNTGNLIIRGENDPAIWQSFDHPTDTLLPGMGLQLSHRTRAAPRLIAWKGPNDPSLGEFSLGADPHTPLQIFTWHGSTPIWRSSLWTGSFVGSAQQCNASYVASIAFLNIKGETYITFSFSDGSPHIRCTLDYSGKVKVLAWDGSNWTDLTSVPRCVIWNGEWIDAENISGGQNLYSRLAGHGSVSKSKSKNMGVLVSIIVLGTILLITCIYFIWKYRDAIICARKDDKIEMRPISDESAKDFSAPMISFESIAVATDNFSDLHLLGQGGFGKVYKGSISGGQKMAVKRLISGSGQGCEEFKNEVVLIAKLQHRNLVRLLGCCIPGDEKLLVYEYMPNKSLDYFLFDSTRKSMLDWEIRFKIIKGISRGLLYLHRDSRLTIIHRDLKVSNVLLDEDMNPKISDFGMARIFSGNQNQTNTNRVAGTYGYMSPEYAMEGLFSLKSDVYSFGVLLLEIVGGLRNSPIYHNNEFLNLLSYAWKLWNEEKANDFIDQSIADNCSVHEALRCIYVGLLCVQDDPNDRPVISSVVCMLDNEIAMHQLPKQPIFTCRRKVDEHNQRMHNAENLSTNNVTLTMVEGR